MESIYVCYKSKLAKLLTFIDGFKTMMFFGFVITEKESLTEKELKHEGTHVQQYKDCIALGGFLSLILFFSFAAFEKTGYWMFSLLLLPFLMYYIIYGVEYLFYLIKERNSNDAYHKISFERQAYWIAETWDKPCEEQNHYVSFGWWRKNFNND